MMQFGADTRHLGAFFMTTYCQKIEVSGVRCQGKDMLDTDT